jgi:OOP family OmpA-OmpF porin
MMRAKWKKAGLSCLLLTLGAGAASATESGFYVGANLGASNFEIDDELEDVFLDAGGDVDDSDVSVSVVGGYRINRYVGFEMGFVDLGEATLEYDAGSAARVELTTTSSGLTGALIGAAPIGDFEFNFKLGVLFAKTESGAESRIFGVTEYESLDADTEELMYGIGAAYTIADHFVVRLDWTRYADVGDDEETFEGNIDTFTTGFAYRF